MLCTFMFVKVSLMLTLPRGVLVHLCEALYNALYHYTPLKVYTPDHTIKTDLQTNEGAEENENKNVCMW